MNPLDIIKSVLPWIGTALAGPLGGIATSFVADKLGWKEETKESITAILGGMSPEKLAELRHVDQEFQVKMVTLGYDQIYRIEQLNASVVISVNTTMQAETKAEHWPSYSWRPFIGFQFGLYIASLWLLPLFGKEPSLLTPDITLTVGAILGVASFFRGKAQADPAVQNTAAPTQKG